MAASDPRRSALPRVTLVGGEGIPSGVPRHICHLVAAFQAEAELTVISDVNHGGYDALEGLRATHVVLPGLATRLSLSHLWRGWRGLLRHLRQSDADLVWIHARLPSLMGRLALALRLWRPRGRAAFTIHGLPFGRGHGTAAATISLLLDKALLSACPPLDIIYLSQDMADRARRYLGARRMARHRVHVLPNCSDLGPLPARQPSAQPRLVMTGRAGGQKNYAAAAQLLRHLPPDYRLTLCGTGTDTPAFRDRITADLPAEVSDRITFAGPVLDVRPLLMAADLYLLTSRYEGLPIGTLEAFEAGLPIALADFEGARSLVERHPAAALLSLKNFPSDAARITALMRKVRRDDDSFREKARQVWEHEWSPAVFDDRSRALLHRLLTG